MGKICDEMLAMLRKLNHLELNLAPSKFTAGDDLRERDNEFFKEFYFLLIKHFDFVFSVSRVDKVSFEKLFIFDSSTIKLFFAVVGRDPKNEDKKKRGLKVHIIIDALSQAPTFVKIT